MRSVLQKRALSAAPGEALPSFVAVMEELVAKRGVKGLYSGFASKACHLGAGGALMAALLPAFTSALAWLHTVKLSSSFVKEAPADQEL